MLLSTFHSSHKLSSPLHDWNIFRGHPIRIARRLIVRYRVDAPLKAIILLFINNLRIFILLIHIIVANEVEIKSNLFSNVRISNRDI